MSDYDNTNSGALFNAIDKKTKPTSPDYTGSLNVDGTDYWLSSWIKTSKSGGKFMSLSVTPKDAPKSAPKTQPKPAPKQDAFDDSDVPF